MIIKNITFVVPLELEESFKAAIFKATDDIKHQTTDIKAFKLVEQVDHESVNFTLQLSFGSLEALEIFTYDFQESMLNRLFEDLKQSLLYFESHLEKVF